MNVLARRPVQIIVGVVVALALFGGGYAFGSSRAPAATTAASSTTGATTGRGANGGAGGAGANGGAAAARGVANGQILAVNSDSITISVRSGGGANGATPTTTTQLVLVGTGTRVVKTVETDVKLTDLKVGDTVTVAGTPDTASGTISAQTIVLGGTNILGDILGGTQFPGGRGGAGASQSPRPTPTR
ncbi:MAG TPA: hypothetical protein DCK98_16080 [Chloroflexi bacterium]|jgi:hypothetical protein|nr:hypothetical protein [Chloroflexota bacterium]HAL26523.1 hypothetical protein [Chloroflexota bacterium]